MATVLSTLHTQSKEPCNVHQNGTWLLFIVRPVWMGPSNPVPTCGMVLCGLQNGGRKKVTLGSTVKIFTWKLLVVETRISLLSECVVHFCPEIKQENGIQCSVGFGEFCRCSAQTQDLQQRRCSFCCENRQRKSWERGRCAMSTTRKRPP